MEQKIKALIERPQITQRTPEWYRARKTLITASEAAAALDIKPFASFAGSPRALLMVEKRRPADAPGIDNVFTRHGQKYEDEARDIYCEMTGETAYELGLLIHPDIPWIGCSVDGVTDAGYVLEIKCPLSRKIEPGVVPHHYYPQVQICMEICDLEETKFIQYKPAAITWPRDPEFVVTSVPRSREWFADVLPKLREFYEEMTTAPNDPLAAPNDPLAAPNGSSVVPNDQVAAPNDPLAAPLPPPASPITRPAKIVERSCFIEHKEEEEPPEEEPCILFINQSPDDSA